MLKNMRKCFAPLPARLPPACLPCLTSLFLRPRHAPLTRPLPASPRKVYSAALIKVHFLSLVEGVHSRVSQVAGYTNMRRYQGTFMGVSNRYVLRVTGNVCVSISGYMCCVCIKVYYERLFEVAVVNMSKWKRLCLKWLCVVSLSGRSTCVSSK